MIGKAELAKALGWARTRLDRRLKSDPKFPVHKRGNSAGGWEFDLAAVRAYLEGKPPAVDPAQLRDAVKPPPSVPRGAQHHGEATARQRKDEADAGLKELRLQREKEETVSRAEMTAKNATVLMIVGKGLDGIPDAICRVLGLPDSAAPIIREMIDDIRYGMAAALRAGLADE